MTKTQSQSCWIGSRGVHLLIPNHGRVRGRRLGRCFPSSPKSDAPHDTFGTEDVIKTLKCALQSRLISAAWSLSLRETAWTDRRRISPEEHFQRQFIYFGEMNHLPVCSSRKSPGQFYWLVSGCVFRSSNQVRHTADFLSGLSGLICL